MNSFYITKEYFSETSCSVPETPRQVEPIANPSREFLAGTLKWLLYFQFQLQFSDIGSSDISLLIEKAP